jgi:hypothetical protein
MKLHHLTIDELIRMFTNYGGHRSEARLKNELNKVNFTIYEQQSGNKVLITDRMLRENSNKNS